MNILMIQLTTEEKEVIMPNGLLYAASSVYRHGHNVKILDPVKEHLDYSDIKEIIKGFSPGIIGMSGITSCYSNCKELIGNIKKDFAHIPVVVGGVISSVSDLLLEKARVDYIVHGEGEITFPELIKAIENGENVYSVKGISFLKEGLICKTELQEQIKNLDDIPFPEFSLLKMDYYLEPAEKWLNWYFKDDKIEYEKLIEKLAGKYIFPIITSRGCTHKCIFCYRHHKGIRQHSVTYVISMMKHILNAYKDVGVFQIGDELTTANRRWILDFCDNIIKENLGIFFIMLSGRVDNVDEEMLVRLKEAGCLMINYGYESGSDTILKEIRKGVTREQALKTALLTKKVGIKNIPEIIIGFPSETEKTVKETIDFLIQLDMWPISVNTPIPFPETPLWDYAVKNNLIKDKEEFISGYKRGVFVNFTGFSDKKLMLLVNKVKINTQLSWLNKRKKYFLYLKYFFRSLIIISAKMLLPVKAFEFFRLKYRQLLNHFNNE